MRKSFFILFFFLSISVFGADFFSKDPNDLRTEKKKILIVQDEVQQKLIDEKKIHLKAVIARVGLINLFYIPYFATLVKDEYEQLEAEVKNYNDPKYRDMADGYYPPPPHRTTIEKIQFIWKELGYHMDNDCSPISRRNFLLSYCILMIGAIFHPITKLEKFIFKQKLPPQQEEDYSMLQPEQDY